jgi:hypothetical protein
MYDERGLDPSPRPFLRATPFPQGMASRAFLRRRERLPVYHADR